MRRRRARPGAGASGRSSILPVWGRSARIAITNACSTTVRFGGYTRRVIVLGIDPGTAQTGFGAVAVEGSQLRALEHGVVTTGRRTDVTERLAVIFDRVAGTDRASQPRRGRARGSVCRQEPAHDPHGRPGPGRDPGSVRPGRRRGLRLRSGRDQDQRVRLRPRRQESGDANGDGDALTRTATQRPTMPPMRWRRPSATLGWPIARDAGRGAAMIAELRGRVARVDGGFGRVGRGRRRLSAERHLECPPAGAGRRRRPRSRW